MGRCGRECESSAPVSWGGDGSEYLAFSASPVRSGKAVLFGNLPEPWLGSFPSMSCVPHSICGLSCEHFLHKSPVYQSSSQGLPLGTWSKTALRRDHTSVMMHSGKAASDSVFSWFYQLLTQRGRGWMGKGSFLKYWVKKIYWCCLNDKAYFFSVHFSKHVFIFNFHLLCAYIHQVLFLIFFLITTQWNRPGSIIIAILLVWKIAIRGIVTCQSFTTGVETPPHVNSRCILFPP